MKKNTEHSTIQILVFVIVIFFILIVGFKYDTNDNTKHPVLQLLTETVTDYDGNIYKTVKIGDQIWMVENLKVTHYRDGTSIPNVYDNEKWQFATDGAYCMVNNDPMEYKNIYGLFL